MQIFITQHKYINESVWGKHTKEQTLCWNKPTVFGDASGHEMLLMWLFPLKYNFQSWRAVHAIVGEEDTSWGVLQSVCVCTWQELSWRRTQWPLGASSRHSHIYNLEVYICEWGRVVRTDGLHSFVATLCTGWFYYTHRHTEESTGELRIVHNRQLVVNWCHRIVRALKLGGAWWNKW